MTLHFMHIGKTGGTAIKRGLTDAGLAFWHENERFQVPETPYGPIKLQNHRFRMRDLPAEDHVFFCLRDPVARFVSAFYSRYDQGGAAYDHRFPWSEKERAVFERFATPAALASALASRDRDEREFAQQAMGNVRHLGFQQRFTGRRALLRGRLNQIVYVARQETLDSDWEQIKSLFGLPQEAQLPSDPARAHKRDRSKDAPLDETAERALREWYDRDYRLLEFFGRLRAERGWGPDTGKPRPARKLASAPVPSRPAPTVPVSGEKVAGIARDAEDRFELWIAFLKEIEARTVAEIGVYRGAYAERVLDGCAAIETYYMVDPWRHLESWNKPANREDDVFQRFFDETMEKTREHEGKRVVLRGTTTEVIDQIPDGSLDYAYVDGDHTLRGISIDLLAVLPKMRKDGWIGGDDFARSIWQHGPEFEPTLVFPFAVYFAEATGSRIYGLPGGQFLIELGADGYEFVDLTGKYAKLDLLSQLSSRRGKAASEPKPASQPAAAPAQSSGSGGTGGGLLRSLRDRVNR